MSRFLFGETRKLHLILSRNLCPVIHNTEIFFFCLFMFYEIFLKAKSSNGMALFTIFFQFVGFFFPCLLCTILCICYFSISLDLWVEVLLVLLFFKETKTKMWSTKFKTRYLENAPQCQYSFTLISSTEEVTCKESNTAHWVCKHHFYSFHTDL